jgi:uracil-DNA glycosylase
VLHLRVPPGKKLHPSFPPPRPTRLLFIAVAPPWGGTYFWQEEAPDKLRRELLRLVSLATGERFALLRDFRQAGYYLVPAVKCPSQIDGNDCHPAARAVRNCAGHLRSEIEAIQPERILTMGTNGFRCLALALGWSPPAGIARIRRHPWEARIAGRPVPVGGTYYFGNNRHRGRWKIIADIRAILRRAARTPHLAPTMAPICSNPPTQTHPQTHPQGDLTKMHK